MSRRVGRPSLEDESAENVRTVLRHVRDADFGGNATTTAKALGMTQSAVSQILSKKNRPSYETAVALAAHLDVRPAAVLAGTALARTTAASDLYPERARALARLVDILPPAVEERVRSVVVHDPERPMSEADWIELALLRLREHQRAEDLTARVAPGPRRVRTQ